MWSEELRANPMFPFCAACGGPCEAPHPLPDLPLWKPRRRRSYCSGQLCPPRLHRSAPHRWVDYCRDAPGPREVSLLPHRREPWPAVRRGATTRCRWLLAFPCFESPSAGRPDSRIRSGLPGSGPAHLRTADRPIPALAPPAPSSRRWGSEVRQQPPGTRRLRTTRQTGKRDGAWQSS